MPETPAVLVVAAGVFGLLLGSFLNVCIYRIPRDLSVVWPRSFCPECEQGIAWYDNVPVVSFLFLKGHCRRCHHPIRLRYPMVEAVTAGLFAVTVTEYGWSIAALKWALFEAIMVVLFWTDLEERILPDELTLGGTAVGLVLGLFVPVPGELGPWLTPSVPAIWWSILNGLAGAFILVVPIFVLGWVYSKLRGREGIGLGDLKLLLLLGVFLGVGDGIRALLIASIAGSVVGVAYILLTRKDAATYGLPFGSFLCAGGAILPLVRGIWTG